MDHKEEKRRKIEQEVRKAIVGGKRGKAKLLLKACGMISLGGLIIGASGALLFQGKDLLGNAYKLGMQVTRETMRREG